MCRDGSNRNGGVLVQDVRQPPTPSFRVEQGDGARLVNGNYEGERLSTIAKNSNRNPSNPIVLGVGVSSSRVVFADRIALREGCFLPPTISS